MSTSGGCIIGNTTNYFISQKVRWHQDFRWQEKEFATSSITF